ncbi:hypothetical protein JWH11_02680 [Xanthomonas melonis]|uniref:Uncharacterized protein n=1 Tax=Xanthomonas melonis TaxID=56456 RepID=A0ABS8NST5_9XANT|nr:hypothetical protein [Xanthomonas melonis]MCC4602043.1 hypothetical protein [Xanthomonas melonis]MCD0257098.1 hypothetical protein [Xanthomonas melonis]MCD0265360.1 hypothetical protein [Xanthomonas melonis]
MDANRRHAAIVAITLHCAALTTLPPTLSGDRCNGRALAAGTRVGGGVAPRTAFRFATARRIG